jgi:diguanylate cyclase (GGDEF)-like protein
LGLEGTSLKARAIVFALAAGAVSFILCVLPNMASASGNEADIVWRAVIPAVVVAAMCWAAAERAVAHTAGAIDAAIDRLTRGARGDLESAIPAEVGECVPQLSSAMADLFTQLNASMSSIERMALYDTVTGLPNRNHFRARCDAMLAESSENICAALLFIDLDRFKAVNDSLGHASGDVLLGQVAKRLRTVVEETAPAAGKNPLIGRLAGDEFTVFLPQIDTAGDALCVGQAILAALSEPYDVHGHLIEIGASIGCALRPDHGIDLTDLMKAADAAMYHAKETGRGQVQIFDARLADRLSARATLDQQLRQAVDHNHFALVFQPQVATADGRIVAAEALLRWRHPTEGLKLAGSFIQRAEENGLIVEIGDWVVDEVAATIARWGRIGVEQRLAINVSQRQVDHASFFRRLKAAMLAADAPCRLLELEITETLAMECSDEVLAALHDLRAGGAVVAIDDFGTGYSNVARLRGLPIDRIKLDRSVVAEVATEHAARTITHALVGLIHGLGCEAVAEGIESAAQADVLRVIGCDAIQGYAVASPMDEQAFLAWAAQPATRSSNAA